MEDRNSLEYLQSLKQKYSNRYADRPYKPRKADRAAQTNKGRSYPIPEEVMRKLYDEATKRVMGKIGNRPLPDVPEAERGLTEVMRICSLGWVSLEYFKEELRKWERVTGGQDNGTIQETFKF